jgi:hypothetical protein
MLVRVGDTCGTHKRQRRFPTRPREPAPHPTDLRDVDRNRSSHGHNPSLARKIVVVAGSVIALLVVLAIILQLFIAPS